jgi:cysteine desulfurase/selenocysteine lyase|tara:strand:+ start:4656 stop:5969 length:1314 start_codon:yes stop_codon:yes gene_type:complete
MMTKVCSSTTKTDDDDDLSAEVRGDFPILDSTNDAGMRIVYLDSAATSQKPKEVLEAHADFYSQSNANVHRGVHHLSARATELYEQSRAKVAAFIHAKTDREIVFTRNASEALNLIANTWGEKNVEEGDEIVLSVAEHHSNIVPWQLLAERKGAVLKFIGLDENECLNMDELERTVNERTKLVSLPHVSNVLGFTSDVERIVKTAKSVNATVVLDACQSVPHMPVDVQALGADFIVASGHKMCGPTGIGFLWGKYDVLSEMPPWMGGGEMIQDVYLEKSTYAPPPGRFEAGTPAIAEAVALGAACDYLSKIGMDRVHEFELELGAYLYSELVDNIPNIRIYGPNPLKTNPKTGKNFERASLAAFNVDGVNCSDICTLLDQLHGVGCRSGHHCTQPLHRHLDVLGSARASLYIYNTKQDVDAFIAALKEVLQFFAEPI